MTVSTKYCPAASQAGCGVLGVLFDSPLHTHTHKLLLGYLVKWLLSLISHIVVVFSFCKYLVLQCGMCAWFEAGPVSSLQDCEPKKGRPCREMSAFPVRVALAHLFLIVDSWNLEYLPSQTLYIRHLWERGLPWFYLLVSVILNI